MSESAPKPMRPDCMCPPVNVDCEHPTCPRFIPERRAAIECAEHLRTVAQDVREAGDVPLVRLSKEGVTTQAITTLADELWTIALRLDHRMSNDQPRPSPFGSKDPGG